MKWWWIRMIECAFWCSCLFCPCHHKFINHLSCHEKPSAVAVGFRSLQKLVRNHFSLFNKGQNKCVTVISGLSEPHEGFYLTPGKKEKKTTQMQIFHLHHQAAMILNSYESNVFVFFVVNEFSCSRSCASVVYSTGNNDVTILKHRIITRASPGA